MSPEDLIEASKDLLTDLQDEPSKYGKQAPECISQLLALIDSLQADIQTEMTCIDEQAKRIRELEQDKQYLGEIWQGQAATIMKQILQIKKLQSALIIYRMTLTEAQKTEATPNESMKEKEAKAIEQLRAEMPEEMT